MTEKQFFPQCCTINHLYCEVKDGYYWSGHLKWDFIVLKQTKKTLSIIKKGFYFRSNLQRPNTPDLLSKLISQVLQAWTEPYLLETSRIEGLLVKRTHF